MSSVVNERARGFTLIELLTVVSIIVIVSAASIPMALNFVRHYHVIGAANNVAAQMQQARGQAVRLNSQRGVLLNFNYPQPGMYQWTSLDPNPETGAWDGPIFPNFGPKVYVEGVAAYGAVPAYPFNTQHPDPANGIMSPHGTPTTMPDELAFDAGASNALLFRADGSVRAVIAGPGAGVIAVDGTDWRITLRDPRTNIFRSMTISRNGRVRIDD